MNCPNCGVYNPEDRQVCWRCSKELPKPVEEPKKKDTRGRSQLILMVAAVIFFVIMSLQFCGVFRGQQPGVANPTPSGYLAPVDGDKLNQG